LLARYHSQELPLALERLQQIEVALFDASVGSLHSYCDDSTIQKRLCTVLQAEGNSDNIMSAKGINVIPSSPASPRTTPALEVDPPPSSVCNRLVRNHQEQLCGPVLKGEKVAQNLRNQQQYLLLLHHASECPAVASECKNPHCAQMKDSWKHMTRCDDIRCTVAGCYYGRRVLYHYHRCKKKIRCQLCGPVLREKVAQNLRNQQQYLLLLHHASECPAVASECENPHCAQMEDSWKHMTRCDDIHCTVAGCYYGRRVLYHYHRCKKKIRCQLCGPVLREKVAQRNQVRQANRVRQLNENAVIPSSTTTQQRPRKKPKMSKVDSLKPSNPGLRGT